MKKIILVSSIIFLSISSAKISFENIINTLDNIRDVSSYIHFKDNKDFIYKKLHIPINTKPLFTNEYCNQVIRKKTYISCYSYDLKLTKYEAYTLYGDRVGQGNYKHRLKFYYEPSIPREYRAYWYDYKKSGYDRGHIRSDASTDYDYEALKETYSMVNVWGQTKTLNRKVWLKVERYSRYIAKKLKKVEVLNIAYFKKKFKRIGKHKIAVPDGMYKILYNKNKDFIKCFYFDNIDYNVNQDRLKNHTVDCHNIKYIVN